MKNKINILLVSPFFFPTNTYQQELCQKIIELYPNIEIEVLCYQTTKTAVKQFGPLKIHYIPCFSLLKDQFVLPNYFSLIRTLKKLNKEKKFNLLMTETRFFDSAWWMPFLAKRWRIPCLIVEHCASSIKHQSSIINDAGKILDGFVFKYILNRYSVVACSNQAVFDYLSRSNVKNLKLIGTGVDYEFFNRNKRKVSEDQLTITFASRLLVTKGVELFYQAVKPLVKKYPKIKFVIAGDGPFYQKIKTQIMDDNNMSRVELTGSLSKEKIAQLYADSDIFVYPSFHQDGIANVLLEAGASGCAVISSNFGGSSELIKNEKTGILLDDLAPEKINRAIEELITDKKKRLSLAKALRFKVESQYQWFLVAQKTVDLIVKAVDHS